MVFTLRLAVATEDFGLPLRAAIHHAAGCGIQGVRLNARNEIRADQFSETGLRQLRHLVAERQLKIAGLLFPSRRPLYDQQNLERRLEGIRNAMLQVQKLGTTELLIRCGHIPDPASAVRPEDSRAGSNEDVDSLANPFAFAPAAGTRPSALPAPDQQFSLLVELLDDLTRFGNHVGCVLQLQLASYDLVRIQQLMRSVSGGPLGIVFDPATVVMTGGLPVKTYRDVYQHVGYIRARDAVRDVDGAGVEVALGEGVVDWTELLPTFSESNFPGWLCVERGGGDQRVEDVRSGVARLSQLLTNF